MFESVGIMRQPILISLVMGVASGMPTRKELLPILRDEMTEGTGWQTIAIGREEVWPLLREVRLLCCVLP